MSIGTALKPAALTLKFSDAQLEAQFNREYREVPQYFRLVTGALLGLMVLISITGLFVQFSVNRHGVQRLLWFAMIPLSAAALACLHTPSGARRPHRLAIVYIVLMGAVCIAWPRFSMEEGLAATYGFSYTAFLLFAMFAFARLSPLTALSLGALLLAAYVAVVGTIPGLALDVFGSHIPLLLGTGAVGFSIGYLTEFNERRAFALRMLIEQRESQLSEERDKLRLSEARLIEEKGKSEALLLSVLPQSIVARLKEEGRSIADGIVECTVLFCDLVGFTALAQEMGPRALVSLLNRLFSAFDSLCEKHGLEKIKTIGDAYMVAGGVPEYVENHAAAVADMALEMLLSLEDFNRQNDTKLGLRIGMHSGPVVAGIIGTRKFSYDLWGDTVNTAARMESHGEPGRVQMTEATGRLLGRTHAVEERGFVEVKGKGRLKTFWLTGRL
jgi:class 3 adenylate cyclase